MNAAQTVRRTAIAALAATLFTVVLTPTAANAAPAAQTQPIAWSQAFDLPDVAPTLSGVVSGTVGLSTHLSFAQTDQLSVGWDDSTVKQGAALDPIATRQPGPGTLTVDQKVHFTGTAGVQGSTVDISFPTQNISASTPCSLGADGDTATCVTDSSDVTVIPPTCPDIPASVPDANTCPLDPQVSVKLRTTSTFSVSAVTAARMLHGAAGSVDLGTGQPVTDTVSVPCTTPVGDPLAYELSSLSLQAAVHTVTELVWTVTVSAPVVIPVFVPVPPTFSVPGAPNIDVYDSPDTLAAQDSTLAATAPDVSFAVGAVAKNNVPPTVSLDSMFTGDEGSAIAFGAAAAGPCAAGATFTWNFSDGGVAYGDQTTHTFTDAGPFTGQVIATDVTGLSGTADFGASVTNLPPAVTVTPAAPVVAWGRSLTLQAQAVDPGSAEQSTLTYAWDFHDGSAVTSGGPSEAHVWADPGSPTVTVTVCDRHGGCTSKDVVVTVRARTTTTSYTGDTTATYSAPVTYSGSVIDEFSRPVVGATVGFATGSTVLGTATTGGSGSASTTVADTLSGGSYPLTASYGGDSRYVASSSAPVSVTVTSMATAVTYTGTLSSKPNAKIPLSATVTDVRGVPLPGQTVTFTIGKQTVTAQTGANGVASTTLKLAQKPGSYPVAVSWPGAAGTYAAASWTGVFKLNTK